MLQCVVHAELPSELAQKLGGQVRRGHTIIDAPKVGQIDQLDDRKTFRLALWERGGGKTNTGEATVITTIAGARLEPAFVKRGGHLSCANHALFSGDDLISVTIKRRGGNISGRILRHIVENKQEKVKTLWEGKGSVKNNIVEIIDWVRLNLPRKRAALEAAVRAAIRKSYCYHCRGLHFAAQVELCNSLRGRTA